MDTLKKDLDHIRADGIDSGALYKRVCKYLSELLSYKATGLTPEEVEKLKAEVDFDHLKEIWGETPAKVEFGVPLDRLQELLQAEEDGRLVVLPCKVGDTVYRVFHAQGHTPVIGEHKIATLGDATNLVGRMGERRNVSTYLTRPEAEAAVERLKGEGEHG